MALPAKGDVLVGQVRESSRVSLERFGGDAVKEILRAHNLPINIIGQILEHQEGDAIIALK